MLNLLFFDIVDLDFLLFAVLVTDGATGLASRLTAALTFSATAVLSDTILYYRVYMLHSNLRKKVYIGIIPHTGVKSKYFKPCRALFY